MSILYLLKLNPELIYVILSVCVLFSCQVKQGISFPLALECCRENVEERRPVYCMDYVCHSEVEWKERLKDELWFDEFKLALYYEIWEDVIRVEYERKEEEEEEEEEIRIGISVFVANANSKDEARDNYYQITYVNDTQANENEYQWIDTIAYSKAVYNVLYSNEEDHIASQWCTDHHFLYCLGNMDEFDLFDNLTVSITVSVYIQSLLMFML
ncbi:hypothetical protein RFI_10845 [Reticulomyxa filosa]|uniref:Uncharacterized protein n=1 Tax=Reticulomyxa filosa TaxID=46433 RepID=X6NLN1_RETFI|nr:hypothetical protein RFI_10845 [Reticulomyxa filosa]|eukprot:ETO26292.1 hypothetical protein RFI_10845 [Reticulomyxa filosa]